MSVKNFRERSPLLIGIIGIILITLFLGFSFSLDKLPFVKQAYMVEAEFADAAGLKTENQVRIAGVKVGTIESIELAKDRVLVTMEIENDVTIPEDAFASVKLATILGTKFVDIESKGGPPYLADGDKIPLARTSVPYEIYQAANQGTGVLEGLDGQALNDMLVELTKLLDVTQDELGGALEGLNELGTQLVTKQDDFKALLRNSEELTAFLADEGDQIVELIDASNIVLANLAGQREDLQRLLEGTKVLAAELTDAIRDNKDEIGTVLARLDRALEVLNRNVEHIDVALKYAGPSTKYFARIFTQGRWGDIYSCALILTQTCEFDPQDPGLP